MSMRLAFLVPLIATLEGGRYRVNANYGRLVDELSRSFGHVEVLAGMPDEAHPTYYPGGKSLYGYAFASSNVEITPVPISLPSDQVPKKTWAWLGRLPPYWRAIRSSDLAFVVMPGFSGLLASLCCRVLRRPYILYYASDWGTLAPFMARWGSSRSPLFRLYFELARWLEARPVPSSLFTLVAGQHLWSRLRKAGPRVFETRPMVSFGPEDFHRREDTCGSKPISLLSVGGLMPSKGVHHTIEALAALVSGGIDARLTLAGAADAGYLEELREKIRRWALEARIEILGLVMDKARMLDVYRAADVFVIATESEGFPRVIYEAMSQSLPVVATSIPAIASVLENERQALLVPPGSAEALAGAISRIASQPVLRRELIANGFAFGSERLAGVSTGGQILNLLHEYPVASEKDADLKRWARTYYSESSEYRVRLASKWSESWSGAFAEYTGALLAEAPAAGRILDLGCGAGQTASAFAQAGHPTVGGDLFLAALREFPHEKLARRLSLVNCDAASLPFCAASFASAGTYTMLEHVPDADAVLREIDRVLVPGETLVICGPNMLSPFHAARLWWRGTRSGRRHPDGTPGGIVHCVWRSLLRALSLRPRFLYRQPMTQGLEFAGSDYDAIFLMNPYDLLHWLRAEGYEARNRPTGTTSPGRLIARLVPNLSGGLCIIARKPGRRP